MSTCQPFNGIQQEAERNRFSSYKDGGSDYTASLFSFGAERTNQLLQAPKKNSDCSLSFSDLKNYEEENDTKI